MEKRQVLKKIGVIVTNILLYVFMVVAILGVVLSIAAKKDTDGAVTLFGRQMRYVLSPSMEKCDLTDVSNYEIKDIPTNSMVFIEVVPEEEEEAEKWYADLKIGDVLTFKYVYVTQETITHRITGISANSYGGYTIRLEGDNKNSDADTLTQTIDTSKKNSPNYVIGKVTGQSYALGLLVAALKSPIGLIFIVIIPALAIVIYEIFKIISLLTSDKKRKAEEELVQQKSEIDRLKQRLAELESEKAGEPLASVVIPQDNGVAEDTDTANSGTNGD